LITRHQWLTAGGVEGTSSKASNHEACGVLEWAFDFKDHAIKDAVHSADLVIINCKLDVGIAGVHTSNARVVILVLKERCFAIHDILKSQSVRTDVVVCRTNFTEFGTWFSVVGRWGWKWSCSRSIRWWIDGRAVRSRSWWGRGWSWWCRSRWTIRRTATSTKD